MTILTALVDVLKKVEYAHRTATKAGSPGLALWLTALERFIGPLY